MLYNGFEFNKLDVINKDITDATYGIPAKYGIYQWVYWPEFDATVIKHQDLITLLKSYTLQNFYFEEEIKGLYKFHAKIWEQGYKENNNIFGLSTSKSAELEHYLTKRTNIVTFSEFFKEICFVRPFYIGKANNLRSRLSDHFAGNTGVLGQIVAKKIPDQHIWVGYKDMPYTQTTKRINTIFEEIYSRRLKPGLTIKPN